MITLYRQYDIEGDLLYVGISLSGIARTQQHRQTAHWYKDIATITFEKFHTREEALEAERKAIRTEMPLYNIQHNCISFDGVSILPPDGKKYYLYKAPGGKEFIVDAVTKEEAEVLILEDINGGKEIEENKKKVYLFNCLEIMFLENSLEYYFPSKYNYRIKAVELKSDKLNKRYQEIEQQERIKRRKGVKEKWEFKDKRYKVIDFKPLVT